MFICLNVIATRLTLTFEDHSPSPACIFQLEEENQIRKQEKVQHVKEQTLPSIFEIHLIILHTFGVSLGMVGGNDCVCEWHLCVCPCSCGHIELKYFSFFLCKECVQNHQNYFLKSLVVSLN